MKLQGPIREAMVEGNSRRVREVAGGFQNW